MKQSKAIVTLAIGEKYLQFWQRFAQENWQNYADKHGYDLICIDKPLDTSERAQARSASWQKCLILSQEFSQQYERIVWIDSDILINTSSAPCIVEGVPIEKVGAVDYWSSPTPELLAQTLEREYDYWESLGIPFIKEYTAKDYYTNYGLPSHFEKIVQAGVMVLSPHYHREICEKAYFDYEEKGGPEWHYEMRPLSYELLKADCVHWIDHRFNLCLYPYMMLHYPFLLDNLPPDYSLLAEPKIPLDLGVLSHHIQKKICATTAFINSFFLHFAGCGEMIHIVDLSATSWRDCRDAKIRAGVLHDMACTYAEQGQMEEAIAFFHKSLELKERIGDVLGKATTLTMLGQLFASGAILGQVLADDRGEFATALDYLQQSLQILQQFKSPDAEMVEEMIANVQQMAAGN
ncbi:tetratricopeptide repeat protein [Phormidium sp. LEGE 05292]|uniref:tetratricopeptide repeat protein n=1 Tax=[Phormidium] sp. LEGE 05292 TaxID=767427 RepID=UPI001882E1BE|nr:tetratricopeptide repeat protein [Phormidium sp. LEGE 05292]MBE9224311.1 tetratricopeptide repeat protein [Phormidium sp. LEGE 05292]